MLETKEYLPVCLGCKYFFLEPGDLAHTDQWYNHICKANYADVTYILGEQEPVITYERCRFVYLDCANFLTAKEVIEEYVFTRFDFLDIGE